MLNNLFAAVDIGTYKTKAVIAQANEDDTCLIVGAHSVKTLGFDDGLVVDMQDLVDCVSEAVEKAEYAAKTRATNVVINLYGSHVRCFDSKAAIIISDKRREITEGDIYKVTEIAKTLATPFDRKIVHCFELGYVVDEQENVKNPLGMLASKLEVHVYVVTALIPVLENLTKALHHCGAEIRDIVLSGVATSYAVLSAHEKDLGVVCVEISSRHTDIVIYAHGKVKYVHTLSAGLHNIIEAISRQLKIPYPFAWGIYAQYATLDENSFADDERFIFEVEGRQISFYKKQLYNVVYAQVKWLLSTIIMNAGSSAFLKEVTMGAVLCGELPKKDGFLEMAETAFNLPARLGYACNVESPLFEGSAVPPEFAPALGLVRYSNEKERMKRVSAPGLGKGIFKKPLYKLKALFEDYF
jgi:cell division protein FtsA